MSYSNGKLPEDTMSHDRITEIIKGLPGVGFKLTSDGDYDISNKKLTNVASPQTNNDASTKSYVDSEVFKTLKLDGSNAVTGALNMNNRRIENVGPGRHGTTDVLTHLQLEAFYFDLNTDSGNIEAQNPINMKNERILGVKDPLLHSDASNKFYVDSSLNFKADKTELSNKADKTELANYLKKDGSVALTNNLDLGNNEIVNVKEATSGTHAVNLSQLLNEKGKHLLLSGGDMTGDIRMNDNSIYEIKNVENDTSAVNRKFVKDELNKKADKNQVMLLSGFYPMNSNINMNSNKVVNLGDGVLQTDAINKRQLENAVSQKADASALNNYVRINGDVMTGDLDMSQKRIINIAPPSGQFDATRKSYVDNQVSTCLKLDGSNKMNSNLDMNNQQIKNVKDATHHQDAITLKQVNDAISTTSTNNNKYTDQKIAESHVSTHENPKNVWRMQWIWVNLLKIPAF